MGWEQPAGMGLAATALASGAVAIAADAAALGLLAGIAGTGAGIVAVVAAGRAGRAEAAASALAGERDDLETARATNAARVAELEVAVAARLPAPEPDPDNILRDPETGLPGESFFAIGLEHRIAAARRHLRPVAVVLLEVSDAEGGAADAAAVADLLRATLRSADTACRLEGPTRFGLVLEDTPENGAVWSVERFRRAMAADKAKRVLRAGIACYPAHAFDAEELRRRATDALLASRQWRQDRIEVATATEG